MRLPIPGRARPRRGDPQYAIWEFARDIDTSMFTRGGWWALSTLVAVGAAWVAARTGTAVGLGIIAVGTLALFVAAVVLEQGRWHAQDVLYWYQLARAADWVRDTGSQVVASFDVAANEVWLGAHQPGTVPQVYRALAAHSTGDPTVIAREMAALPADTPLNRVERLWVMTGTWDRAATADLSSLRAEVTTLPEGRERRLFEAYLAHVDALRLHREGSHDWLTPLAAVRPTFPRASLGVWRSFRVVLSRFAPAVWFAVVGSIFVATLPPMWAPSIPPAYATTAIATRGDLPKPPDDWNQVWLDLPAVADALRTAKEEAGPLDQLGNAELIDSGQPSVVWEVTRISLEPPQDQPGRHVAQLEILLGSSSAKHGWVLVTFDDPQGPTWLYDVSPSAIRPLQDSLGVLPGGG